MKRFFNYCEKNGISASRETYGANYFNNAPALYFDGAQVVTDCTDATENMILKYCKRNGFSVFAWGRPGFHVLNIMKADDKKALDLYHEFMDQSVADCEREIHAAKGAPYLNDRLTGIMWFYGLMYNAARTELEKETA